MSFHKNPKYQIPALVAALKAHRLEHDTPSQLADAFRTGWVAALAAGTEPAASAVWGRAYVSPVRTVADLANNLLTMDQTLPIYGAQYIDHPTRGRCAIAVHPTLSRERVKDERWIGAGDELNAAVVWTRAPQPVAVEPMSEPAVSHCINRMSDSGQLRALVRIVEQQCALNWGLQLNTLPAATKGATP